MRATGLLLFATLLIALPHWGCDAGQINQTADGGLRQDGLPPEPGDGSSVDASAADGGGAADATAEADAADGPPPVLGDGPVPQDGPPQQDAAPPQQDAAPPQQDAGDPGTHPFPFSFDDPQYFANVSPSGPISLSCGANLSDLSITAGDMVILNACETGTTTITRFRLGGDGGANGSVREGYRCTGSGTMNIASSWLEAKGQGDDHADIIQCYDPNNSPTARMNVSHTTIRGYDTAATAGLFVADYYALDLTISDTLFWGAPYGLRFHTDGRPGTLSLRNVCFYGEGPSNHSFGYAPYLLDPYRPAILEWTNVNWCTIENGQLIVHGPVAAP